ncbi:hypothetical protein MTO96_049296 [Rhipicephalus appendiculatus]
MAKLTEEVNLLWAEGRVPEAWRTASVVLIPKPGKALAEENNDIEALRELIRSVIREVLGKLQAPKTTATLSVVDVVRDELRQVMREPEREPQPIRRIPSILRYSGNPRCTAQHAAHLIRRNQRLPTCHQRVA